MPRPRSKFRDARSTIRRNATKAVGFLFGREGRIMEASVVWIGLTLFGVLDPVRLLLIDTASLLPATKTLRTCKLISYTHLYRQYTF